MTGGGGGGRPISAFQKFTLISGLFILGTYNTVITKVLFTTESVGKDGVLRPFVKPAFGNWTMFLGMSLSLIAYRCSKPKSTQVAMGESLLQEQKQGGATSWRSVLLIGIPASFDLVAMGLSLVGIILIPASIWQMLRGAEIIFAALLTRTVLGTQLARFHWFGVFLAMVGIAFVSVATIAAPAPAVPAEGGDGGEAAGTQDNSMVILGIALTLGSQVITAAQIITEEKLLTDLNMDALLIVGVEGIWGFALMTLVVYPILVLMPGPDHGHGEDVVDTWYQLKNSWLVQLIAVADVVSCLTYNIVGMKVTESMSGVMRTMLEATRTLMVWVFNLGWHYLINPRSPFGESWTNWSYLELVGFFFLFLGQVTYSAMLKWPGIEYPIEADAPVYSSPAAMLATNAFPSPHGIPAAVRMASPNTARMRCRTNSGA